MTRQGSNAHRVSVEAWNIDAFSARLREAMVDRTPYSIQKQTGIAQSLIGKYLDGVSTPGTDKLVVLANALGVSVAWLATGEPAKEAAPSLLGKPDADLDALEEVVSKIRRMFRERSISLKPEAEARIVRLVYEYYLRQGEAMDEASLNNVIELAAFR